MPQVIEHIQLTLSTCLAIHIAFSLSRSVEFEIKLNDQAVGAIEALAWVLSLLDGHPSIERIRNEVASARDDLLQGVSVDFRERIRIRT